MEGIGKECSMKTVAEIFSYFIRSFKSFWPQFPLDPSYSQDKKFHESYSGENSYKDDEDMERLVRIIEKTRDENSLRY